MEKTVTLSIEEISRMADILKSIAHPLRLRVIELLDENGPMTVSEIVDKLQIEQSLMSHHLTKLKDKRIVTTERKGKNIFYRLKDKKLTRIFECMVSCSSLLK